MSNGSVDNDLVSLVMRAKGVGFQEAVKWLADIVGFDLEREESDATALLELYRRRDIKKAVEHSNRSARLDSDLAELPEHFLGSDIIGQSDYFTSKGISEETQRFFGVGLKIYPDGVPRATIPIKDIHGRLVSVSGRRIDCDDEPRYQLAKDFDKQRVLYNLDNASRVYKAFNNIIILVEGFKAAWAVHDTGFTNVVACMGAYVLEPQVETLGEYLPGARCLLLLDGDSAGKKGLELSWSVCAKYFRTVAAPLHVDYPGKSPDDLPQEELMSYIEKHVVLF